MRRALADRDERGFTLIELLVVILIIAILASIAIPIYLNQREKAWISQVQSALKNAALAAESYAVSDPQGYADLNNQDATALAAEGFAMPDWASGGGYVRFRNTTTTFFCIEAQHADLSTTDEWRRSTYMSTTGRPSATPNAC